MPLYLIRHPVPLVAPGTCYGRTDVAVSMDEQMRAAALLTGHLPPNLPTYSSPAIRCTGLADLLTPGPVIRDARLAEMDFGNWEMRRWDDIAREEVDGWAADPVGYRPGGGETVLEVTRRVHGFYQDIRPLDAIVVCHAGSIRLLRACAGNVSIEQIAYQAAGTPHQIGFGELYLLER